MNVNGINELVILMVGAFFVAMGVRTLWQKYFVKKVDITSMLNKHMPILSLFASDQRDKLGRGILIVSEPGFRNVLGRKVEDLGKYRIGKEEELIMDYVVKSDITRVTRDWYKSKQIKAVISLVDAYDPKKEMVLMTMFPGLPIRTSVVDLEIKND